MALFTLKFNLLDDLFQNELNPGKNPGKRLFGEATGCVCLLCVNDFSVGVSGGLWVLLRCALNPC